MKITVSRKPKSTLNAGPKSRPLHDPVPVEIGGGGGPAPDAKQRLTAFYAKHPLRTLKRGERGIVESLKADRDRR